MSQCGAMSVQVSHYSKSLRLQKLPFVLSCLRLVSKELTLQGTEWAGVSESQPPASQQREAGFLSRRAQCTKLGRTRAECLILYGCLCGWLRAGLGGDQASWLSKPLGRLYLSESALPITP